MPCLERKWVLDNSFIIGFLLLDLSSSWALGKRKDLGRCAEIPSPKSASLGWEFGSSCSICGMSLSWGSTFVSSGCLVVAVCSVVAVSPSLVSSFTVIGGDMKYLKESIRR